MDNDQKQIIIPESINKVKGSLKGWFTWMDLLLSLPFLVVFTLPLILGFKTNLKSVAIYGLADFLAAISYAFLIYPLFPGKGKLYQKLGNVIKHMTDHTKYGTSTNKILNITPFEKIDGNILRGSVSNAGIIKISGVDIFYNSTEKQDEIIGRFSELFTHLSSEIDFVKINRRSDYEKWSEKLTEDMKSEIRIFLFNNKKKIPNFEKVWIEKNISEGKFLYDLFEDIKDTIDKREVDDLQSKIDSLEINIEQIEGLDNQEFYETTYFLILKSNSIIDITNDLSIAEQILQSLGHNPKILEGSEIVSFMSSYYKKDNIKLSNIKVNLNDIYPSEIIFKPKYIKETFRTKEKIEGKEIIKEEKVFMKIVSVSTLPSVVLRGWLSDFLSYVNDNVVIKSSVMDSSEAIDLINKKIKQAEINELDASDEVSRHSTARSVDSMRLLMADLQNGQTIQKINIFITFYGSSPEELKIKFNEFKKRIRSLGGYKINAHNFEQKTVYGSVIPRKFNKNSSKSSHTIPTISIAEGYPPTEDKFQDPGVPILGYTPNGSPVFLDLKVRNDKRVNSNMTVIGQSGGGKSFFLKKVIKDLITQGVKFLVIDPEGEYGNLAKSLSGQTIDMGGSSKVYLNPLQAFDVSKENPLDSMTDHITHIQRFLELSAVLNKEEAAHIPRLVSELFKLKKITYKDIYDLKNEKWPTIFELEKVIKKYAIKQEKEAKFGWEKIMTLYHKIQRLIEDDKKMQLWGHTTNVKMSDVSLTTFDLNRLMESPNNTIKTAQMYLLLNFVWNIVLENKRKYKTPLENQQMVVKNIIEQIKKLKVKVHDNKLTKTIKEIEKDISKKQTELKNELLVEKQLLEIWNKKWIAIVFDEAHLMLDKNNRIGAQYLYTMVKRIRKYNGILIITTQNIKDFTGDKDLLKETSAMLNNVQYFVSFGLKPEDIGALNDLRREAGGITNFEKHFLSTAKRGQCLAFLDSNTRAIINIDVSPEEKQIMGETLDNEEKRVLKSMYTT